MEIVTRLARIFSRPKSTEQISELKRLESRFRQQVLERLRRDYCLEFVGVARYLWQGISFDHSTFPLVVIRGMSPISGAKELIVEGWMKNGLLVASQKVTFPYYQTGQVNPLTLSYHERFGEIVRATKELQATEEFSPWQPIGDEGQKTAVLERFLKTWGLLDLQGNKLSPDQQQLINIQAHSI